MAKHQDIWLFLYQLFGCGIVMSLAVSLRDESMYLGQAQPFNSSSNTGWMVTGIIFIILFVLMLGLVIYLHTIRNQRIRQFYANQAALQQVRNQQTSTQGGHI